MRSSRHIIFSWLFSLVLISSVLPATAQYGITFDVKKPKEFENRVLRSEKSDQKKFTIPKRFVQNTITHYNYFFNANNKLNEVITRAKLGFRDDYSQLLPFYNYTLDATAGDSIQLDSIAYKAQTGIVLHDLRSDWADNLYLLWGASYYLQKQFDSAYLMFQFINYAFAEKESDGYYRTIGSNRDGNQANSIATKEKNSLPRRLLSEPPSRNDAFIWQIRNYLAQDRFVEAGSVIATLRTDPAFPNRLRDQLEEVQAYSYYKQGMWDSSAAHLVAALDVAGKKQERARWEYLLAQLYEKTNHFTDAEDYYAKAIAHTTDPILDIYARLYSIRVNKDGGENYIEKNIAMLVKMARRDKYVDYRDIIYYMAAQMELERDNIDGAIALLKRSTSVASNSPTQRNKAFLQLAELSFKQRQYRQAYNYYDSIKLDDPAIHDPEAITARKTILGAIAQNVETISRQDSLQRLAALPEEERNDIIKKMVRKIRKQRGLKGEEALTTGAAIAQQTAPNLFSDNGGRGEWYFYNTTSRQKGYNDFKTRWGNRPNKDNWRRSANIQASANTMNNERGLQPGTDTAAGKKVNLAPEDASFENISANIPLTEEQLQASNDSIQAAMLQLGTIYIQQLEDCAAGTDILEQLRTRFPDYKVMDQVYFNLYFCYNKNGETEKALALKKLLNNKFPQSNYTTILNTGKNPRIQTGEGPATKEYEKIYDLFIEGNFEEAIARKRSADSIYGANHWTPQLLYIESVYYIKKQQDSIAKIKLQTMINTYNGTPLGEKAITLLTVLNRRKQIEEELTNLVINRPAEDSSSIAMEPVLPTAPTVNKDTLSSKPVSKDTTVAKPVVPAVVAPVTPTRRDSTITPPAVTPSINYTYNPESPHYVVIMLNKVDGIFVNEVRNAFYRYNRETFFNKQMQAELVRIDNENALMLMSPFKNAQEALDYIDKTKPKTATEILPWLKTGKFSYSIITDKNLELLKTSKNIEQYKQFIEKNVPGRF